MRRACPFVLVVLALAGCGASSTLDGDRLYTPIACAAGTADCDGRLTTGCETDVGTHDHCGACNVACDLGQRCVDGTCATGRAP